MNIFEDMKVFIKPLGVVSPVSEIVDLIFLIILQKKLDLYSL